MDNFMDRLVERMNDRGHGPDSDMPGSDNRFSGSDNRYSGGDRMDYSGQDDSYGYGRSQRQSAPSIGRRDLDELGRAIISAQKQMADNQSGQLSDNARMIDAMRGALLDQAKGLDEGFKEQNEKIDASAEKILKAIQEYRDKKVSIIVEGVDTFIWDSQLAKPGQATLISKVDPTDEKDRIRRATKIDTEPHINRETKYLCTVCIDPSSGAYTALYFQPYK